MISSDVIRGYTDIMILYLLLDQPSYGYEISKQIRTLTDERYVMKETTLYSAFSRLEENEYIQSFFGTETNGKRRTYYRITPAGLVYYKSKIEEWDLTQEVVQKFIRHLWERFEMEAIKSYLNNMFTNMPNTKEVLRAKEELGQMMEDKYTELRQNGKTENEAVGAVISEFGNLEELGPQLGIAPQVSASLDPENRIAMDGEQVNQYLQTVQETSTRIGQGVAMCILAAVPLILLTGLGAIGLDEKVAAAIGIGLLMLIIGAAVYLFIVNGMKTEKYEDLEKHPVSVNESVAAMIRGKQDQFRPIFARKIASGVLMIILGAGFLAVTGVLSRDGSPLPVMAVIVLLGLVALAVYQFITVGMEQEAYQILLNTGDYTKSNRKGNEIMERYDSVYWTLVVVIYLVWSFTSFNWGFTWIVWPIAAVLYALLSALLGAFKPKN